MCSLFHLYLPNIYYFFCRWYDTQSLGYFNSRLTPGTSWHGRLLGISDYENNPNNDSILLKLESGDPTDWFIGFNRASGINSESQQAQDLVTIHRVNGGDGLSYSQSFLKGVLQAGKTATIPNWRLSGYSLVIRVNEINTKDSPGYADVSVMFGPQPQPTPKPSRKPTKSPTLRPSSRPTSRPSSSVGDIAFDSGMEGGTKWSGFLTQLDKNGWMSLPLSRHLSNGEVALSSSEVHTKTSSSKPIGKIHLTTDNGDDWQLYLSEKGEVTLVKVGLTNGKSETKGQLTKEGQTETIQNWRKSGHDLVIVVKSINGNEGYAEVDIEFGEQPSTSVRHLRG